MFEWLEQEINLIKTPSFHVVDGPISSSDALHVMHSPLCVPLSYKSFVIRFGNAKLYRQGNTYQVQVFSIPREAKLKENEDMLCFGRTDLSIAYFKFDLMFNSSETPVFEWSGQPKLKKSADGFEEWLNYRCRQARDTYSKEKWREIILGPRPFSVEEMRLKEARRFFRWELIGISGNGDLKIEVQNHSKITLRFLTIGVKKTRGDAVGAIWLPVACVLPGETKIISKSCYKNILNPQEVELFDLPDTTPELRDRYWEFKTDNINK